MKYEDIQVDVGPPVGGDGFLFRRVPKVYGPPVRLPVDVLIDCVAGSGSLSHVSPFTERLRLEARRMAAGRMIRAPIRLPSMASKAPRQSHRVGKFNAAKRRSTAARPAAAVSSAVDRGGGESGGDPPQQSDEGEPANLLRRAGAVRLSRGPPGEATGRKRADVPSRLRDVARKPKRRC